MKLFNPDESYTVKTSNMEDEICSQIKSWMRHHEFAGYNYRELALLAHTAVQDAMTELCLEKRKLCIEKKGTSS